MQKLFILLFFFGWIFIEAEAQQDDKNNSKIEYESDLVTGERINGVRINRFIGNVIAKQESTISYCDSAVSYRKENIMDAFKNVRIVDDSTTINADKLHYDGNSRLTELRGNVIYNKNIQYLYTENLDYNLDTEVSRFFGGGKLKDTTNTLTSDRGYYYAQKDYALFYGDVILVSPDFTLKTDTLEYNTITKVAYSQGKTYIEDGEGAKLYSTGGEFRTEVDQSLFAGGMIQTEKYDMTGDDLFFDEVRKYYRSKGHTLLTAKEKDLRIFGDEGYHDDKNGISKIYGSPVMQRILKKDTFYLAADTIVSIENEIDSLDRILAYHNIRIYKTGLQGRSDSSAYFLYDSLIFMYQNPILWNYKNQVTSDTISLEVTQETIEKLYLENKAFLVGQDTLLNFNQIKGHSMEGIFINNEITTMYVTGNAEGLYYVIGKGDSTIMGMNKFICSTMKIGFEDQAVKNITIYKEPSANFIPPHELTQELMFLKGYTWKPEERPHLESLLRKSINIDL